MKTAIHWFRRDLRLTDNTALRECTSRAEMVVPVYIASEWTSDHRWTGPHRQQFLCESLESLADSIGEAGGRLLFRQGDAVAELEKLVSETKAEAIFFNRDPDPYGRAVEEKLAKLGRALGVEIVACKDVCLHERDEVLNGSGKSFRVFTPYAKAWSRLDHPEPSGRIRTIWTPDGLAVGACPSLSTWDLKASGEILHGGEAEARERLKTFVDDGIARYAARRNTPGDWMTSRISQDLRYGLLSIREVFHRCAKKAAELDAAGRAGAQTYISELIWREFYMQILWHHPNVLEEEFDPSFRHMPWPGKEENLVKWQRGETGFPIVDAAMRQLNQTGFMHNRARMITAMFLTKDLHLDWRLGESYFMQQLTDGEIASNNGGWQWSAGTGADAAPYFRIQNPWTQTKTYDPDAEYVKKWVPELKDVPAAKLVKQPAERLARDYPPPIVDHAEAREKTLKIFAKQKEKAG